MKEINPPEGSEQVSLDLQLDPGLSVRLAVVGPEGKPVEGASVSSSGSSGGAKAPSSAGYELTNLGPGEERTVIVWHEGAKLGKARRVKAGADGASAVVFTLAPLATIRGRTVDADHNPVPAARVRADLMPGGDFMLHLPEVVSDRDGRFEIPNVPTGCDYSLNIMAGTMIKERRHASADASVRPGETTDVGDIAFKKD